jgi:cation-transporting ATPase I
MAVSTILSSVTGLFRARARRAAVGSTRAHVEFRETGLQSLEALTVAVQRISRSLGRLRWVDVNADTQRVVFAFEEGAYGARELCDAVEAAEREAGLASGRFSEDGRLHPADEAEGLRRLVELIADGVAFAVGLGLRVSPLPSLPFGGNLVALISVLRAVPRLRRGLEARLGQERAELVLSLASSLSLAMTQRPLSSLVDGLYKLALVGECRSQRALWQRREPEICQPGSAPSSGLERRARPVPLPRGPIEEYADRSVFVSLGGFALSFLTTRSFQRASAALFGALPRPARLGREVFSARLAVALAARGVLVLDRRVLRRLDRIDCLVLHGELLAPSRAGLEKSPSAARRPASAPLPSAAPPGSRRPRGCARCAAARDE